MSLFTPLRAVAGCRMAARVGIRGAGTGAFNDGAPPGAPVD